MMFGRKKEQNEITEEMILAALRSVKDPDLKESIVQLGFVKNIRACEGVVAFNIELTTPACPVKEKLEAEAIAAVKALPGVKQVNVTMTSNVRTSVPTNALDGLKGVKNIIAISSGKGGVGKSTVSVNLALALARTGASVGLMDADVYGPSVPKMLAGVGQPDGKDGKILPFEKYGIKFMSMGLLTDADTPVIWRGPMATKLIQQFLGQVLWGDLDYLLIDLPPGTGDVQLTLTQSAPLTGAVVVTTPQEVAVNVTMRGIKMFDQVQVPILGLIENMSSFVCPHCDETTDIFRKGGGEKAAKQLNLKYLGSVPIDPRLALSGDEGKPVVTLEGKDRPISAKAFDEIAKGLAAQVSVVQRLNASVTVAPKEITKDEKNVIVRWADGSETKIPFHDLRAACPCAECVDEWTGAKRLREEQIPMNISALSFQSIGRYGVRINWSDGHGTGIYTYDRLKNFSAKKGMVGASLATEVSPEDIRHKIIEQLRTIFDPEIPVNIYELGLVYGVDLDPSGTAQIKMTLTAPNCPAAESLPAEVDRKVRSVPGVKDAKVEIVWDPPWGKEMMSEAARLQLGI